MLKVSCNKDDRIDLVPEATQLGMTAITLRLTAQHGLSEQCFAPECYQAGSVEIFGVEAPEPHCGARIRAETKTDGSNRRGRLSWCSSAIGLPLP